MTAPAPAKSGIVRFGVFELDIRSKELRKAGVKVKLEGQPLEVLQLLLERPGELVTREELQQKLWPADTFVDFEHSINAAIRRLRDALGDSAENPRFVETLPRRGYRFICPVNSEAATATPVVRAGPRKRLAGLTLALLLVLALLLSVPAVRERVWERRIEGKSLRVAVLPLRHLSGDLEQEYFAAGMTEMLITELGRIPELQVTSHQSVLRFGQSKKPLSEIAGELDVDALLEGTVQRTGQKVRVTVNFVQARPENHLLAKSYEKVAGEIFEVQQEVARAIADAIQVRLPPRPNAAQPTRQISPEAADAYLRGTYLLAKGRDRDRDEARVYFQKAIEIEPAFARPYAALAVMYSHGGAVRMGGSGGGRKLTRQWAEKALQLDESLAEAHAALGWLGISDWDFASAEKEFKRAIALNPSLAVARAWYAQLLGVLGRCPEAFGQTEVALQLAPGAPELVTHAVEPYFTCGRVDDALFHWQALTETSPDYGGAHYYSASAYMKKGMYREAVSAAEEAARLSERSPLTLSVLASAYALAGQREKARRTLDELELERQRRGGIEEVSAARVYATLGDHERALTLLEQAHQAGRPALPFVNTFPQFDSLRRDARFKELVRRVGLPDRGTTSAPSAGGGASR